SSLPIDLRAPPFQGHPLRALRRQLAAQPPLRRRQRPSLRLEVCLPRREARRPRPLAGELVAQPPDLLLRRRMPELDLPAELADAGIELVELYGQPLDDGLVLGAEAGLPALLPAL